MICCVSFVSAGGAYAHVTVGLCLLWRVRTSRKIRQPVRENKKRMRQRSADSGLILLSVCSAYLFIHAGI